jgi:hypothetical protein
MSSIKKINSIKTYKRFFPIAAFFIAMMCFGSMKAEAATLFISSSNAGTSVGKTIVVRVVVNSSGQSINAISGGVTFSNDLLTLTNVSKSASIVTLWAQEPSFSNASGTISFQGVILNGYTGGYGTVLTLTFRAKAQGTATIDLASGSSSVLLNDGQGTNVLAGTSGATIAIGKGILPPPQVQQPVPQPNPAPSAIAPTVPQTLPVFTEYQDRLLSENFIVAKGTADPNSTFTITLTHVLADGTTTITQTPMTATSNGTFTYVSDQKVAAGTYRLVITTADGQATAPLTITVTNPLLFVILTWIAIVLSVKIPVLFALLIMLLIVGYFWHQNRILKKHLRDALEKVNNLESKL